jgi:hypothetical protein
MLLRTRCVLVYSVFKVRGPQVRSRVLFNERNSLLRVRARSAFYGRFRRPMTSSHQVLYVPLVRRSKITPTGICTQHVTTDFFEIFV